MFLTLLLPLLAAFTAPSDPATHLAERDKSCTAERFVISPLPDGRRNYREKRSGIVFPSGVGRLSLAACAVGEGGFEIWYETDPANPTHERCAQQFVMRHIPGHGAQAHAAVADMAARWGEEARPVFGNRRIGTGDRTIDVWSANGATMSERGKIRRIYFGYAKGDALVVGGENRIEDPFCTHGPQNSQTFLREFPWP